MKVSVLTPLYKAYDYFDETANTVLSQTFSDFEWIIVDDCGNDGSLEKALGYQQKDSRVKVIRNEYNMGIAASRNRGLDSCQGEYIAILDDDDLMMPDRLELQVEFLDSHPEIGAVGGNAQWIGADGELVRDIIYLETEPIRIEMFLCFRNIINNSEMTFRKTIVEKNNIRYMDNCLGMEDYRFWIDFSKVSAITNIAELVLKRRMYEDSTTSLAKKKFAEKRANKYLEIQKYSLEKCGFVLDEDVLKGIKKYLGEEHYVCSNLEELVEYVGLMTKILIQCRDKELKIWKDMSDWFYQLIVWQVGNVWKSICPGYTTELEWLRGQRENLLRQIQENINNN
ncbi:Glycosyltransferase involved in cell wall bisynthesis [Butyrivibrio sp. ob235]|uniref:glycosyltransferase family 2 protein n=1 Tax=Butyrivibrio sp. ob235 TaxID=1761780 RepID=UPI0008B79CC6|nr:glycosyltransferase family 2 protein [Butyrivibrio sp. ob235]SEL97607.1 Glycosyltransferase involved in cell wall bisynthesis [Butyrivibrio sp. ob235]